MAIIDEMVKTAGFRSGMLKAAEEDTRPEPGYWAKEMAGSRAIRSSDKGFGKVIASNEVVGGRMKSGLKGALGGGLAGGIAGAAIGHMAGRDKRLGALLGAAMGGHVGNAAGTYKFNKNYLKSKGIKLDNAGFSVDMTDEAKQKYLSTKYRGGGYKS